MAIKSSKKESIDKEGMFNRIRDEQLSLCGVLEEIADSLPHSIDRQVCIHTARILPQIIDRAHRFEEDVLFPLLENSKTVAHDLEATISRLKNEHVGDKCFAEELGEVLMSYGLGKPMQGAEATGYMLRGFFEALRRHIAFERELFASIFSKAGGFGKAFDNEN